MYLLDTCTLLWLATDTAQISKKACDILKDGSNPIYVSSISALEIGIKNQKGKLDLPMSCQKWFPKVLEQHSLTEIPVSSVIAALASELNSHGDPADRIIMATSIINKLTVLTPDKHIQNHKKISTIW